jgi:DNA-binding transcriptional LysR family regulator
MDWITASKHFVLIVELGSFAEAARQRYTTSSALSKQINWLEDHLQTKLLHRTTRHLSITEAGQTFYTRAKKILNDIHCLEKNLQEENNVLRGTLRISCPAISQQSGVLSLFPLFLAEQPGIRIELLENPRQQDMVAAGIDLAIVEGYSHNPNIVQERLGSMVSYVYGSPDYFKIHGTPKTPEDLLAHNCLIHTELDEQARWEFKDNQYVTVRGNFASNTSAPLIEACKNGLGLIKIDDSLIENYVIQGLLVPILEDYSERCVEVYAVYPKQPYSNKIVETFIKFMQSHQFSSVYCRGDPPSVR